MGARGLASREARLLGAPSQASTKPQLSCDLASCILFSLQSRLFILLPLSQAITTHRIPAGLLLSLGIQGGPQREPNS